MTMTAVPQNALLPSWENLFPGAVLSGEAGSHHTSMGVGGKIDLLLCPESLPDMGEMIRMLNRQHIPWTVIGNGTNLIITERGCRGAVICTRRLNRIRMIQDSPDSTRLKAETGVSLHELVSLSVREQLTGLEFCAGIPGSVGGAVRMNAGAYGHNISELLHTVTMMNENGGLLDFAGDDLCFEYRHCHLPEGMTVVQADFLLRKDAASQVAERVGLFLEERRRKHPLQYKNAGSIFKNPKDQPAGRLIEEAGLKGFTIGDAMVSEKHGNFIVNRGRATADDILALIRYVRERIAEERGIHLELEVKILGES